jgi:hypothetical protein
MITGLPLVSFSHNQQFQQSSSYLIFSYVREVVAQNRLSFKNECQLCLKSRHLTQMANYA